MWRSADRLQRTALVSRAFPNQATRVQFLDGTKRAVPRHLAVEMSVWESGELADEIHASYVAYAGGDVLDVGAWHGLYSLSLAAKANPGDTFVSFEPDTKAFPGLLETLAIASRLFPEVRFVALPFAAGTGEAAFVEWPEGEGRHPAVRSGGSSQRTVRLDHAADVMQLRPTFVKIDVEGAELDVLRGMPRLITAGPTLMVELHPWETYEELDSLLPNYRRVDITPGLGARTLWTADIARRASA